MRIAVQSTRVNYGPAEDVVAEVRRAAGLGLTGYWAPMLNGQDTLTVLALAGREVGGIELGTAVVPMPLRSPYALAMQMRTVQEIVGGRLTVALGTSHEALVRDLFRAPWGPPLATARAYLEELAAAGGRLAGPPVPPTDILLGAVNPAMVRIATELAAGVVTWAAAEKTVGGLIADAVRESGRGDFRVVASLPVCVTDDPAGARAHIHKRLGANDGFPSYRKVLEREGVGGIAELSVVGSAVEVRARLARFAECGTTDFAGSPMGADRADVDRTWELLGELAAGS